MQTKNLWNKKSEIKCSGFLSSLSWCRCRFDPWEILCLPWLPALEFGQFLPLNLLSLWVVFITFHLNTNSVIYWAENRIGFWKAMTTLHVLSKVLPMICRSYTVLPLNHFCWLSLNSSHISAIEQARTEFINSSRYISLQFSSLNLILLPAHTSELFRSLFIISPCSLMLATPVTLEYDCTIRKQGSCRAMPQGNSKQYWVLNFWKFTHGRDETSGTGA